MKIAINLYQDSLKPVKEYWTLNNVAIATAIVVVAMLMWAGNIFYQNHDLHTQAQLANAEIGYAEAELKNFQTALVKHNDSATYTSQKNKLEKELQVKSILLQKIITKQAGKDIDFHKVMKDLTEHHEHELWLTEFLFNKNDVMFIGYTTQSFAVTRWLTFLQSTPSFQGREFSHLQMTAVNGEMLSFQAGTSSELFVVETEEEESE